MVDIRPCDKVIILGRQGENLARRVIFEKTDWVERFGAGTFQLIVKRNGDPAPYPADITQELTTVTWEITSADTASEGYGAAELYYFVGDVLAKSEIWQTRVLPSLGDAGEEPPEPYQSWVDSVLAAAQSVEEAVGHYPYIDPTTHHWMAWDVESESWYDTGVNAKGEKGDKGDTGEQGIPGEKGEKGEDGYTPVRGVDYWTPEDQSTIVSDVQTAIAPELALKADASDLADTDRRLSLLYDLTRGQSWRTETSTTPAYSKSIPSGAHAVELESIGGKSIINNQQIVNGDFSDGTEGWAVNPSDASITATDGTLDWSANIGGSASIARHVTQELTDPCVVGHKYLIAYSRRGVEGNPEQTLRCALTVGTGSAAASDSGVLDTFTFDDTTEWVDKDFILTATEEYKYFNAGTRSAVQVETHMLFKDVRIHDLTQMFGSAIAATITTPEQAYALGCPREYIPYVAGTVISADVDKVVTAKDGVQTAELTIPAAVRALTGYGQSAVGGDANSVDFAVKTYTEYGHYVDGEWVAEAEPIVTDVSDILTDFDTLMDAEGGGTLTFRNANELPVPNEETYYINISEALG